MAYNPVQLGQNTMANSSPVVIASNQTKIPVNFDAPALSTATWTTATSLNTTISNTSTLNYATATVTSIETGTTTTAGALTFEVYDGTNWWAVQGQQVGDFILQSSYTLVNNTNIAWQFDIAGFQGFRVRLSTAITGTGSPQVVIIMQIQAAPNDIAPTVGQANAANLNATIVPGNATGSTVPANAFYIAGDAATGLPTAATGGNLTGAMYDKFGRQVVLPVTIRDLVSTQTTTISASTSETTIVTAGASGVFNDLMMLVISNTSASTTTRIDFRDTTGGSILFSLFSPAGDTRGFSMGGVAIPQTGTATNWTAQCATSTTDIRVYAVYAKNK